jgi:hypothetical protein
MNKTVHSKIRAFSKPNTGQNKSSKRPNSISVNATNSILGKTRLNIKRKSDLEILESQDSKVGVNILTNIAKSKSHQTSYFHYNTKKKNCAKTRQISRNQKTNSD